MADDKIDYFPSPGLNPPSGVQGSGDFATTQGNAITFNQASTKVVLRIKPDGVKVRGSDDKPLTELSVPELLTVIDELCDAMRHR